jgi:hypothetical protein
VGCASIEFSLNGTSGIASIRDDVVIFGLDFSRTDEAAEPQRSVRNKPVSNSVQIQWITGK